MELVNFVMTLHLLEAEHPEFVEEVRKMLGLLDIADQEDTFGTQGWKYYMGWDDA